jgi:hypothetical protein
MVVQCRFGERRDHLCADRFMTLKLSSISSEDSRLASAIDQQHRNEPKDAQIGQPSLWPLPQHWVGEVIQRLVWYR